MAQTLVDISHVKDETARTAIDAVAQVLSNANFNAAGTQSSAAVGTAADLLTTAVAANVVTLTASGTDTNIDIKLVPAGTGTVAFGASVFTANGSVATAMSSLGPTGSHTTIQKWLTIKDSSGTVLYVPCF